DDIPGSSYAPSSSNPSILLPGVTPGAYLAILTDVIPGTYQLDTLTTNFNNPVSETTLTGVLASGGIVAYQINITQTATGPLNTARTSGLIPGDLNGDQQVDCDDVAVLAKSYNLRMGQAGFNAWVDKNGDGVVDLADLAIIFGGLAQEPSCPAQQFVHSATVQSTTNDINVGESVGLIDAGVAKSLLAKLSAAVDAGARGNPNTENNILAAFANEVESQQGKHIDNLVAQILLQDVSLVQP